MVAQQRSTRASSTAGSGGPADDRQSRTGTDPTENVLALVAAAVDRLNDLMEANHQLVDEKNKRQDDLRNLEAKHIREVADLREMFADKLRSAETERINAIRAVDVGAVGRASEVSAAQAITLATQVATSAETLRTQVQAAAAAAASALVQALEPIQTAISDLRKAQYEQQGQTAQRQETRVDQRGQSGLNMQTVATLVAVAGFLFLLFREFGTL